MMDKPDEVTEDERIEGYFLYQLGDFLEKREKAGKLLIEGDLTFAVLRHFFKSGWLWGAQIGTMPPEVGAPLPEAPARESEE
jgi:hypothetical protein